MSSTRYVIILCLATVLHRSEAWGSSSGDRVLLSDVQTLTLYNGRMTTGRRSTPVPQVKCVGGSAGCSSFVPQVVQCYNRGSDGVDTQWECKTDMDNAFRFGKVDVTCEGYDYPEDPYILRGSCGLEYTLDFTKEGYEQQNRHNEYRDNHQHSYYGNSQNTPSVKKSNMFGDLVLLVVVGVIIYAVYRTCIAPASDDGESRGNDGPRGGDGYRRGHGGNPPPYGFRDDYTQGGGGCSSSYTGSTGSGTSQRQTGGGGGFWSGAGMGGLLGYMFGSRTNQHYHQQPHTGWGSGWGSGLGGSRTYAAPRFGGGFGGGTSGFSMGSTGTRSASGFGGTKRR